MSHAFGSAADPPKLDAHMHTSLDIPKGLGGGKSAPPNVFAGDGSLISLLKVRGS